MCRGGGGGGGGGATFSLLGESVSLNQRPRMRSLSSSVNTQRAKFISKLLEIIVLHTKQRCRFFLFFFYKLCVRLFEVFTVESTKGA